MSERLTHRPLLILFVVGACLAGAELAGLSSVEVGGLRVPVLWPPAGVLLGGLIVAEGRRCSVVIATGFAIAASLIWRHHWPTVPAIGISVIQGLEACLGAWFLRQTIHERFSLGVTRHVGLAVATIAGVSMLGGLANAELLELTAPDIPTRTAWLAWWLADAVGMLVTTPLVVAVVAGWRAWGAKPRPRALIELAVVLVAAGAAAHGVFGGLLPTFIRTPAFILPIFLWASVRFGPGGASAAILLVTAIGAWHTADGQGPFALPGATSAAWVQRTQGTAALGAISLVLLGSMVDERRRALRERAALVEKLQATLTELRVLQGMIPICAWCHKIRDDAGYWQQIETYVEAHSAATFSHSICPACTAVHDPTPPQMTHAQALGFTDEPPPL